MKTRIMISLASAISAISLGLATDLNAQEVEGKARVGGAEGKARIDLDDKDKDLNRIDRNRDRLDVDASLQKSAVTKMNKASGLLGMQVKNHLGENLGEIQDLVLDLPSGRVSYAVLSVGGFLGIGEKYIAIPPNVFTLATDENKLVLNADKAKIQGAPGFAKTNWPDLNNPNWGGFAYWDVDVARAGSVGRTGSVTTDRDRDRIGSDRQDRDRLDRDRSDRLGNRDKALGGGHVYKGKITAINPETRTMTIAGDSGTMTFSFTEKPTLTLKEMRNPRLTDLKVGYPVSVGYHDEGGTHMAHSVIRTDSPEVK